MKLAICLRNEPAKGVVEAGRFAEQSGYDEVWLPDSARGGADDADGLLTGRDAFTSLGAMFASTSTVRGAIGVAALPLYQPKSLTMIASSLAELSDDRFTLGVGVSHQELAARHGLEFPKKTVSYMRDWVRELKSRSAGGVAFGGGWPVMVAALGPKMVQMAAEEADGLVLNWLTPEHAAISVDAIRAAAPPDRRPEAVLYLRLMRSADARVDAVAYDQLDNYHRHFVAQGLDGPDEVAAATGIPADDIPAARDRIEQYRAAGIDRLCIYPNALEPSQRSRALEALTA